MGEFALGQPVPRFEDPRLIRGGGRYVDDLALPHMAYGYVLRSPHAHARIRGIDTSAAKAAPGVLLVLTGADWAASGWADLPTPGGLKRQGGAPAGKIRFPALTSDKVRWVGDYVAFVVAETLHQAQDAAELIEVDYETLPAVVANEAALEPGAPLVWDDRPDNICFVHPEGNRAATEAALAKADRIVKRRFVINRVTAAAMEPRGAVADYNKAEDRYTVYTVLQRAHGYRADLAGIMKVPESKIRVVAGDIGGSFGMKSAVYNEVALVTLASKMLGRPVKWTSTRVRGLPLRRAGARPCHRGRTGARQGRAFPRLPGQGHRRGRRLRAGQLQCLRDEPRHARRGLPHAGDLRRGDRGLHQHQPDAALSRQRAAGIRLCHRAHGRRGGGRARHRAASSCVSRNMIPPEAMPFKSGLTFTYDCGEFAKNLDLALKLADFAGFEARRAEAKARGKLRGIGLSNTIERAAAGGFEAAEVRFDKGGTATLLSGSITQGMGHETVYKQLLCDRLGMHPDEVQYIQGDTDKVAIGEGTGGSRSAALGGSAVMLATEKIVVKARAIAAHMLDSRGRRCRVRGRACSPRRAPTARCRSARSPSEAWTPASLPPEHGAGPHLAAPPTAPRSRTSPMAAISANWRSTPRPARSNSAATTSSTMSAR